MQTSTSDGWMVYRVDYEFVYLRLILPPIGQRQAPALQLISTNAAVFCSRYYVFSLLHLTVSGNIKNCLAFRREQLTERNLVLALIRASQPVFDDSLDHAIPRAFRQACLRTA